MAKPKNAARPMRGTSNSSTLDETCATTSPSPHKNPPVTIFVLTGEDCKYDSYHSINDFLGTTLGIEAVDACLAALLGSDEDEVENNRIAERCMLQQIRLEAIAEVSPADPQMITGAAATGANLLAHRANIIGEGEGVDGVEDRSPTDW